jgi:biotin operon repressor
MAQINMSTKAATFASKRNRAAGLGDTRPTFRRLGVIAGMLRRDLTLPSCARLGVKLECSYKTIQRDIDLLRDFFGYPLEYDRNKYQYKLAGPLPKAVL